jgi:asparagine synthase (glutamine-hydrolysing)
MSGMFGIFNRDGKPPKREKIERMLDAMSYWEPDEQDIWLDGSVALGHAMLWNAPESKYEHLPLHDRAYVLTMDARIDNRDELLKELELPDRPLEEIGDSEFILAAYKKWGEECPKYLLGDFSFVIWDKAKQQLFCARDPLGVKLFHYCIDNNIFIFSNDIQGVLSHPDVSKEYDNKTIAICLRDSGVFTQTDTFFEHIKKLPGGKTLIVTDKDVIEQTYWKIEDSPKIHYDTFEKYVDALRKLLEKAVEARIRTQFSIVSHLSGGIDCSPIAVLAARRLRRDNKTLHAFNWVDIPEDKDKYEIREWEFSRRIAQLEQIQHHEFCIDPSYMTNIYDEHDFMTKGTMSIWNEHHIQDKTNQIGARTILSGWGGDELISFAARQFVCELIKEKRYFRAFKMFLIGKKNNRDYTWRRFMKHFILSLDPPFIRTLMKLKRKKPITQVDDYTYLKKDIIEIMKKHPFLELPQSSGVHNNQIKYFNYGHIQQRIESWALLAFSKKIEYAYPLLDRRIVEFAIGIPEDLFFHRNGHERFLMRSAIHGLLPDDIAWSQKIDTTKVNQMYQKRYEKSLELWYEKHKDDVVASYDNDYVEYGKIIAALSRCDFQRLEQNPIGKVVTAVSLINSIKKHKY